MAVHIGADTCCLTVQQLLEDISQGNVTNNRITNHGALQWTTSSMNRSGFEQIAIQDPGGKNLTNTIEYVTNPRTDADTTTTTICTAGTTIAPKFATVNTDLTAKVTITLNEEEFRGFCRPRSDGVRGSLFADQQTMYAMNQLFDQIDSDTVQYAADHVGNFYNGVPGPKNITVLRQDGSVFHGGLNEVNDDMSDAGTVGIPAAWGLGYLRTVTRTAQLACCDQTGIDLTKLASPWIFFEERKVDELIANTQNVLVLAPGALQMISRVTWVGAYEEFRSESQSKTTVNVTPPGGGSFPVDFTVQRDFCGDDNDGQTEWILTWIARYGFFDVPSDLENVGSPYRSINGIFHYTFDCGDITCADDVPS